MDSSTLAAWAYVLLGVVGGAVVVITTKPLSRLFQGRSNKEIVEGANAIIDLYKSHIDALTAKVNGLETTVCTLTAKLEETLEHNQNLQKLLLASPPGSVPGV